ncbi:MAG: ABC transporter substrate-binding protein [Clostridiales bacterium]|nr:ABC transporter substrate-binding protein [Clostridiales bacterium]
MITMKWKSMSALLLAGVVLLAGCGSSDSGTTAESGGEEGTVSVTDETAGSTNEEFTVRVGVNSGDQNSILKIVDEHTGLFSDKGIHLETTEFAAGINTIDAIELDQVDIGLFADYAGVNRFGNTSGSSELRAFTQMTKSDAWDLYVNPDAIQKPEDLYDASLISSAGVVFEYYYARLFEVYGLDISEVTLQNVTSTQEALALAAAGTGDAYWCSSQTASLFEKYGWEPFVSISDIDAAMYTFMVAGESYLTEHSDEVIRFLEVSEEGFEYIAENLEQVAQWVEDDLGLDQELFISDWESTEHVYEFTQEAYDDLVSVKDWCYQNGKFDTDFDISDFINTDVLKQMDPDRVTYTAE